jgi:hypothetical protein
MKITIVILTFLWLFWQWVKNEIKNAHKRIDNETNQ